MAVIQKIEQIPILERVWQLYKIITFRSQIIINGLEDLLHLGESIPRNHMCGFCVNFFIFSSFARTASHFHIPLSVLFVEIKILFFSSHSKSATACIFSVCHWQRRHKLDCVNMTGRRCTFRHVRNGRMEGPKTVYASDLSEAK